MFVRERDDGHAEPGSLERGREVCIDVSRCNQEPVVHGAAGISLFVSVPGVAVPVVPVSRYELQAAWV